MFHFSVKSKIFKNSLKSDWFNARIFVDSEKKELHFSHPTNDAEADDVEYETDDVKEDNKVEIEPPVVKLIEFKQPKRKMPKKEGGPCSLEFNGRALFSGKSLRLRSNDVSTFQEFFDLVNPLLADQKSGNKISIIDDPDSICGDYATVAGDHETVSDENGEMNLVSSKIYDSFMPDLSFPVTLHESTASADDVMNRLRIDRDDELQLYLATLQLQLLGKDECLIAYWKYNQIKELRYFKTMLKISFGRRTVTGAVSLCFTLDADRLRDLVQHLAEKFDELDESEVVDNPYYDNVGDDVCSNCSLILANAQSHCSDDYYTSVKKSVTKQDSTLTSAADTAAAAAAAEKTASSSADTDSDQSRSGHCDSNDSRINNHHQTVERRPSNFSEELRLKINSAFPNSVATTFGVGPGVSGTPLLPPRVESIMDEKLMTFTAEF